MIDLTFSELPHILCIDDVEYEINTDFRLWIKVDAYVRENESVPFWIFTEDAPPPVSNWQEPVMEFLTSPNVIPRSTGTRTSDRLFDFVLDGDYIVASFQQAYGIDLTSCEMHWHRFLALFSGLPENTKMSKIMSYRAYDPADKRKHEKVMQDLKHAWKLPLPKKDEEEIIEYQKSIFGGIGGD